MNEAIDVDAARERLLARIEPVADVHSTSLDAALGRIAAIRIEAEHALPPFANSAMDGYAVVASDPAFDSIPSAALTVTDRSAAGHPASTRVTASSAVRIFTGAELPTGADAVIPQEDTISIDATVIRSEVTPTRHDYVRDAGSDVEAGASVLEPGEKIQPAHLGLLAAAGIAEVQVRRSPQIAIVSTGDELRLPGEALAAGEIHDGNRFLLTGLLARLPVVALPPVRAPDEPAALKEVLQHAARTADAVICSGGVSVGETDHVRDVLAARGHVEFWRLAMKPGRPFAFGAFENRPFFGLPGNPVSTYATFMQLVRPALEKLTGSIPTQPLRLPATLAAAVTKTSGRRDFQRGVFALDAAGNLVVSALHDQSSHRLSTLTAGNCFIDLPSHAGNLEMGARVWIEPFDAPG